MFEQEQVSSYVSMRLSNNAFNEENYVCRVPRDTVSMNGIVSEITAGTSSIDAYVIMHSAELIKAKILELLKQGRAVDVLELGTMYLKPKGTVTRSNPQVTDLPELGLNFTPSTEAKEAIAEVAGISFMINDSSPEISTVLDLNTATEGVLTAGGFLRITGDKLKVALDDSGELEADNEIAFVPVDSSGDPDPDTGNWVYLDGTKVVTNYNKKLEIWVPTTLSSSASYLIYVQSTYLGKNERRKVAVSAYSPVAYTVN